MGTHSSTSPAHGALAVTPHDSNGFPTCRSLYIGVTGDLSVLMADGSTGTFGQVPVGIFPIQVQRVNDTGTDADEIVALY